jgi:hypothetical protein
LHLDALGDDGVPVGGRESAVDNVVASTDYLGGGER